jgi:hypothetical protein
MGSVQVVLCVEVGGHHLAVNEHREGIPAADQGLQRHVPGCGHIYHRGVVQIPVQCNGIDKGSKEYRHMCSAKAWTKGKKVYLDVILFAS